MDPVGAKLAALYPAPNVPGARPGASNYIANTADHGHQDTALLKIDHNFSERDRVAFHGIYYPAGVVYGNATAIRALDPNVQTNGFRLWNLSPGWFHTFSPRLFSEAHFTYSHRNFSTPQNEGFTIVNQVGLTGVPNGMPEIDVTGLTGLGPTNQWRYLWPMVTETVAEALTWFRGKHSVKFGGESFFNYNRDQWASSFSGDFAFNNVATGGAFGLAALELGWVNTANVVTGDTHTRTDYVGAYIQDDWKVTKQLTLNIGLRYDLQTPQSCLSTA